MSLDSEFAKINELLTQLQNMGPQMAVFKAIEQGLADAVGLLEQQRPPDSAVIAQAIKEALSGLRIEPTVNVPAPIVNVPPAEINLPAAPAPPSGWRMRVTKRDDIGRIAEILFAPEN